MGKNKRLLTAITAGAFLSFLCGCAETKKSLTESFKEQMMDASELQEDEKYKTYKSYEENNLLGEDGIPFQVQSETGFNMGATVETTGPVHVSFANNPYINIHYSNEKKLSKQLKSQCFLNPGDIIYCSTPQAGNENSSTYHFQEFRIYEYDKDGVRSKSPIISDAKDGIAYKIPEDFNGEGISIEPIGKFENRVINLHDYYVDTTGNNNEITGLWVVNEKEVQGTLAEADSTDELHVEYQYDSSKYYVSKADPKPLSNSEGIMKYSIYDVLEEIETFEVYLRHYITLNFKVEPKKGIKSIKVGTTQRELDNNKLDGLKIGDRIIITANPGYTVNCLSLELESAGDNQYTYIIPEINNESIDVTVSNKTGTYSSQSINNGSLTLKYVDINNKAEVKDGDTVPSSTKVTVIIKPNEGYYVTGRDVKEDIYQKDMKFSDYEKNINKIIKDHPIKKEYSVSLDTSDPDNCGTITYTIDKKECDGLVTGLRDGQKIKLTYVIDKGSHFVIDRGDSGIGGWFSDRINSKKEEVTISVTDEIDGTTITRDQYIKVKEGK